MALPEKHRELIDLAEVTDFKGGDQNHSLEKFADIFGQLQDESKNEMQLFIFTLIEIKNQQFYEETGWQLLKWLLRQDPSLFLTEVGLPDFNDDKYPVHTAINFRNDFFLDSLLEISNEKGYEIENILAKQDDKGRTCVIEAIGSGLPCAAEMVKKCRVDTLFEKDKNDLTPLHVAAKMRQRGSNPKLTLRQRQTGPAAAASESPNTSKPRVPNHGAPIANWNGGAGGVRDGQPANQGRSFDPYGVYQEMKAKFERLDQNQKRECMTKILTAINISGLSPYYIRTQHFDVSPTGLLRGAAKERETMFQKEMKSDIFSYLGHDMSLVKKALYGTEGSEKELFLDMSDFNNPAHDFKGYIAELTGDLEDPETRDEAKPEKRGQKKVQEVPASIQVLENSAESNPIEFEDTLFYVCLPDFNNFKEPPHKEARRLFLWLRRRNVGTIKSLDIPDSTVHPVCDMLVRHAILDKFEINNLVWRKLDINLDILTESKHAEKFTEITLYSSGNWSVLYHWVSDDGLAKLKGPFIHVLSRRLATLRLRNAKQLQKVNISIVRLDPSNDEEDHTSHKYLSKRYKAKLDEKLEELRGRVKGERPNFEYNVVTEEKWNFPVARYDRRNEPFVPNLELYENLYHCHSFLKSLRGLKVGSQGGLLEEIKGRFATLTQPAIPTGKGEMSDKRIKIAVIDNGADRIRYSVRNKIAKGTSFVTAGAENGDRYLPWWMVADPHGTQMASLIEKANPFCRLYIARVGKGRKDILPENAAKAVEWAIEQKVDVISISWVTKQDNPRLRQAIERAVANNEPNHRPILVFCSTADEGIYSGAIYPADYDGTVSVAATDQYGHLRPTSRDGVNILVPGDNVTADGPSYMEKYASAPVSGSSVATASAAGIASLALLLLKTFNKCQEKDFRPFYTKEGIMRVFNKMKGNSELTGVQLDGLFPGDSNEGKLLHATWQLSEFPDTKATDKARH